MDLHLTENKTSLHANSYNNLTIRDSFTRNYFQESKNVALLNNIMAILFMVLMDMTHTATADMTHTATADIILTAKVDMTRTSIMDIMIIMNMDGLTIQIATTLYTDWIMIIMASGLHPTDMMATDGIMTMD